MSLKRPARCSFFARTQVTEDPVTYRYTPAQIGGRERDRLFTNDPPPVGDLIVLIDGVYRVLERCWVYSEYGSHDWPFHQPEPLSGPLLQIVVEKTDGLLRMEAEE